MLGVKISNFGSSSLKGVVKEKVCRFRFSGLCNVKVKW